VSARPPLDIEQTVRAELATPGRYHLTVATAHPSILAEAWEWLAVRWGAFWDSIARHFSMGHGTMTFIGDAMVVVCGSIIVFGAVHLLVRLQIESARRADSVPLERPRNAQTYAIAAADAATAGDYTRAVRLLFIAAVTLLDLRGVVHDQRSATVNDLRREVRHRDAQLEAPFVTLARAYTSAAYAEEPLDEPAWTSAQDAYTQLRARAVGT
jgi:hypothetical protein